MTREKKARKRICHSALCQLPTQNAAQGFQVAKSIERVTVRQTISGLRPHVPVAPRASDLSSGFCHIIFLCRKSEREARQESSSIPVLPVTKVHGRARIRSSVP